MKNLHLILGVIGAFMFMSTPHALAENANFNITKLRNVSVMSHDLDVNRKPARILAETQSFRKQITPFLKKRAGESELKKIRNIILQEAKRQNLPLASVALVETGMDSGYVMFVAQIASEQSAASSPKASSEQERVEANRFKHSASVDNSGTKNSGRGRISYGITRGDLEKTGQSFALNSMVDHELKHVKSLNGTYQYLLPNHHVVEANLGISKSDSETFVVASKVTQTQKGRNAGLKYLVTTREWGVFGLGAEYKNTQSTSRSTVLNRPRSNVDVVQFVPEWQIQTKTPVGTIGFNTRAVYSPGGITSNNDDTHFAQERARADSSYSYGLLNASHTADLPLAFSLYSRLQAQLASGNLISSERLSAGGQHSVRGYAQGIVQGDQGAVGSIELTTPSLLTFDAGKAGKVTTQLAGFYDAAYLETKVPSAGEFNKRLHSVGAGLAINLDKLGSLRYDYGHQLSEGGFDDEESNAHHIRLSIGF